MELPIKKKEFILMMIRDHLLCYRLIQGLEKIGFDTTNFDMNIGENIFQLFGFGDSVEDEKLFETFRGWSEEVLEIEFSFIRRHSLDALSRSIYQKLKKEQKLRKQKKRK
ncbi:MAG: hypothetical protein HY062_09200 [Bacteroidetes bacterium]|nr:hypothetical protein [Bacteroidota bacterium]